MQSVLLTVEGFDSKPTFEIVAETLGIPLINIDQTYGIILLDPKKGIYCVLAEPVDEQPGFSSPQIDVFRK